METSEEHLFLLLQKIETLEAEYANLEHEFYNLFLSDDASSSRAEMSDLSGVEDGRKWRKSLGSYIHSSPSSLYCNDSKPANSLNGIGLSYSDEQYLNILQSMGQATHIVDSSGLIIYWNRSAEKLYGYSAAEALGQNVLDLIIDAKEAREDAIDIIQMNTAGEIWTGNFPVKNKQGKRFVVFVTNTPFYDDYGSIIGIICVSFDVQSFLKLPPLPSLEAYSGFSPTSGLTSKPGRDSQQPLEVVATAGGACTLRGDVSSSTLCVFPEAIRMDKLVTGNAPGVFGCTKNEQEMILISRRILIPMKS